MGYDQFKQTVTDFLNKRNVADIVPTLIRFGQEKLEKELRLESMIAVVANDIAINAQSFLEPTGFLEMKTVRLLSDSDSHLKYDPLVKREWEWFVENNFPRTDTGRPVNYARLNIVETDDVGLPDTGITAVAARSFVFDHPLDAAYIIETSFYRKETAFSTPSSTNWWLENAEKAFLYATLIEADGFLANNDPRVKTWQKNLEDAVEILEDNDRRARRGGGGTSANLSHP